MTDEALAKAVAEFLEEVPQALEILLYPSIPNFIGLLFKYKGLEDIAIPVLKFGSEEFPEEIIKSVAAEVNKRKKFQEEKLLKDVKI